MHTTSHHCPARGLRQGLLGLVLLWGVPASARPEPVAAERISAVQPAVARLVTNEGVGTGFLIRSDGLLLTALHVVAGASAAWAHFPSGKVCPVEGLVAAYPARDLALLKLRPEDLTTLSVLVPLRKEPPPAASPLAVIGYPGGKGVEVAHGLLLVASGRDRLQLYAGVRPGYSGGPLLNAAGEAVGVVTSGMRGEKLSFASGLAELGVLPSPTSAVLPLVEFNRQQEGSPEQLYLRALGVRHFWRDREENTPQVRAATEWALQQYNQARAKRPDFESAHFSAAYCYWVLRRLPEAVLALKRTLALAPDHLSAGLALSDVYLEAGQPDAAEEQVRAVLAQRPQLAPAHRRLAACYQARKQLGLAETELRAALRDDPEEVKSLLDLGNLLGATGRREAALAEYRKVRELKPKEPEILLELGKAFAGLKEYREAVETYEAVTPSRPDYAPAHYALAVASLGLGDHDKARRALETLERLHSPLARKLEALLLK